MSDPTVTRQAVKERVIPLHVLKALKAATSPNWDRPILHYVGIRDGRATAADGFILISTPVTGFEQPVNLDPRPLLGLAKHVPGAYGVELEGDQVSIVNRGANAVLSVASQDITSDKEYPDTETARKKAEFEGEFTYSFTLNARLLRKLCNAVIKAEGGDEHMTFTVPVERNHVGISVRFDGLAGEQFDAVIMPMVGDGKRYR